MATKRQAVAALAKKAPGATLINEDAEAYYDVMLEVPKGNHWAQHVHCHCVGTSAIDGDKGWYWDRVIEDIENLSDAVVCDDDDCEGVATWGECEYWEKAA